MKTAPTYCHSAQVMYAQILCQNLHKYPPVSTARLDPEHNESFQQLLAGTEERLLPFSQMVEAGRH